MPIIDELITLLGFEADDSEGKAFAGTLGTIKTAATAVGAAVLAAEGAVLSWTNTVAASTDELGKFGASFGVDIERLQQFEFATERAGGSADELRGDLANLTKQLASPIPGEFNQGLFLLGVNVRDTAGDLRSAEDVLLDLSDRFDGLSAAQKQILAQQVGLSESTLRFISQGRAEIERLSILASDLGGVLPEEATVVAAEYADRLTDVNLILNGIGKTVAISLLPGLTRTLETFEKWTLNNREIITQNVQAVVEGIGRGFEFLFDKGRQVVGFIAEFIPGLEGLTEEGSLADLVFIGFVTTLGILAAAFSPIIAKAALIGTAIGGVILIIEDIVALVQGKKSLIGQLFDELLEKFPSLKPFVENVKGLFVDLADAIVPIFIGLGIAIKETFSAMGDESTALGQITSGIFNALLGLLDGVVTVIRLIINLFRAFATLLSGDLNGAIEIVQESFDTWANLATESFKTIIGWVDSLIEKISFVSSLWEDAKETFSVENIAKAGEEIGQFANDAIEGIGGFVDDQVGSIAAAGRSIGKVAGDIFGFSPGEDEKVQGVINNLAAPPAFSGAVPTGSVSNQITGGTQNNVFNINGAQSPQKTANEISDVLGRQKSELSEAAMFGANPVIE
jgi:hypothetical protein